MAVDQLPGRVREFANYLNGLLARLDQAGGWCAVFWQRDPDGMQACLDGREMPPWDVLEALLQDLAAAYGPRAAAQEQERVRALHTAAILDYDARPGARDALGDRLDVMLREQRYAAERQAELGRLLSSAATREDADALRLDLAWAHDDHERATARCAELRSRMAELDRRASGDRTTESHRGQAEEGQAGQGQAGQGRVGEGHAGQRPVRWVDDTSAGGEGWGAREASAGDEGWGAHGAGFPQQRGAYDPGWEETVPEQPTAQDRTAHDWPAEEDSAQDWPAQDQPAFDDPFPEQQAPADPAPAEQSPAEPTPRAPKQRKRRRGSARFAGMAGADAAPVVVPPTAQPDEQAPAATGRKTPRGARFAGAAAGNERAKAQPKTEPVDDGASREVVEAVRRLVRLRAEGHSGEAHALLVEAAYWPAARYPVLAAELHRAGLGADWATLLWEAASLPADRLVAAADALVAAGRDTDGEQMLRQGVARPAVEVGQAVLELVAQGRRREVRALLDAYVRVRTPEEAARSAEPDPQALAPLLLEAAQGVSEERHWDLVHALRVAGFAA
ncbi:hypothetical protein ACIQI8_06805 [Streptomyces sp. NPDC092369]|uniref:hypothetical protein n=1 Tax=Streptomyces sp. NPDC092369 TaxID=3366015 RepID=UPI003813FEAD